MGTDYTVSYSSNVKVGSATVTVTGIGDYAGFTLTKHFKIKAISLKSFKITVSSIGTQLYTGHAVKPAIRVKYGKKYLTEGTDYTITYKNNTKTGTATVVIKGKGVYTSSVTKTFQIVKK